MKTLESPTNPHAAWKAAHTPGPWQVEDAPDSGLIFIRSHPAEVSLANIRKGQDRPNEANARLIAAVPDLARQLLATLDALADAQAAQAMVVEQCAGVVKTTHDLMNLAMPGDWNNDDGELLRALEDDIRALAPPSGLAKLAELRAERDAASAMAATAYGASLNWEEVLNDEALWQVQDDIAKSRVACMTAEAERDRLAAANAVLEAKVAGLVEALRNLVGPDCMYDGRNIVITAVNHGDAIRLVAEARAALATQEAGT